MVQMVRVRTIEHDLTDWSVDKNLTAWLNCNAGERSYNSTGGYGRVSGKGGSDWSNGPRFALVARAKSRRGRLLMTPIPVLVRCVGEGDPKGRENRPRIIRLYSGAQAQGGEDIADEVSASVAGGEGSGTENLLIFHPTQSKKIKMAAGRINGRKGTFGRESRNVL